jgi:alkylation response protein AidB-like acyl-CoA dehydrogenase
MSLPSQDLNDRFSLTGLDSQLDELTLEFQQNLHRFAVEVLRPIGTELDRMSAQAVIAEGSPYWDVWTEFKKLGASFSLMYSLEPQQAARLISVMLEELTWGDAGLATSLAVSGTPWLLAYHFDNQFLLNNIPEDSIGCWGITEPDHGSDMVDFNGVAMSPGSSQSRPNCIATIKGDEVVINGQKSAWVSNGTIAQYSALFCGCDRGNGLEKVALVVPLDARGVTRGKPLEKLGQRALPQGEIYFDNVSISTDWLIAPVEQYQQVARVQLTEANAGMGMMFAGLARAAFEEALNYTHERKQGGVPIIGHPGVRAKLLHMFRKVEAARALARRNVKYNMTAPQSALLGSISAKITSTQTAFEVASDALQLFGGNGMTLEYPVEKMLRDARASMIEDGCNDVLAIKGGSELAQDELHS